VWSPLSHKWILSSPAARKARAIQNKMDHKYAHAIVESFRQATFTRQIVSGFGALGCLQGSTDQKWIQSNKNGMWTHARLIHSAPGVACAFQALNESP